MKLVSRTEAPVLVITKTETPWSMEGRTGVTYRLGIVYDGDMEKLKVVDKSVYDRVKLNEQYFLQMAIEVRNGSAREPKIENVVPVQAAK